MPIQIHNLFIILMFHPVFHIYKLGFCADPDLHVYAVLEHSYAILEQGVATNRDFVMQNFWFHACFCSGLYGSFQFLVAFAFF